MPDTNVELKPTPEQEAIIESARTRQDSLMVSAYAGCAKSTTLEMLARRLPTTRPGLALAFNKKIATELERRFPSTFTIKTLNGLGHSAFGQAIGKRLVLDDRKLGKLITQVAKDEKLEISQDQWDSARRLASFAMQRGLVPEEFPQAQSNALLPDTTEIWAELADEIWCDNSEITLHIARSALVADIKLAFQGTISFDDQIYCSTMLAGVFPKFPTLLVDEAQDLSPLNHIQLARCKPERLIVCGDPKQAIYGFRGADHESMAKISALKPQWHNLPLATTFRCPKAIVNRQRDHAPGFRAAAQAPEGLITNVLSMEDRRWTPAALPVGSAVLCRNNAPLLGLAFKLIHYGVGVMMLGRDIGKGLIVLSRKIEPDDAVGPVALAAKITRWQELECDLARANDHEEKVAGIVDRGECLRAVLDGGARDAGDLRTILERLFARDSDQVVLSTIHRAKGLEWPLVMHLDPWRVPSKSALRQAALGDTKALVQEHNLNYVCETRTKHTLVLANLEDFHA